MLVHFIASKSSLDKEIDQYRRILSILQNNGHTLTSNWVEEAFEIVNSDERKFDELDWSSIYSANMEALAKTDLVIAEVTARSFAVGFQVATALQQKKPTLLLQRDSGDNHTSFYPANAKDNLLTHKIYAKDNLEQIIEEFLTTNRIDNKDLRFNFFIDRQIYNYLRWAAFKTGKTKAEILRELVQNEIKKQD